MLCVSLIVIGRLKSLLTVIVQLEPFDHDWSTRARVVLTQFSSKNTMTSNSKCNKLMNLLGDVAEASTRLVWDVSFFTRYVTIPKLIGANVLI